MLTSTATTPEHQLEIERMECVCRECNAQEGTKRRRSYCAACGKPKAWPAGTTPLPRREALAQARAEERQRCLNIVKRYVGYDECGRMAADIYDALLEE